jgi:hypothetical protein
LLVNNDLQKSLKLVTQKLKSMNMNATEFKLMAAAINVSVALTQAKLVSEQLHNSAVLSRYTPRLMLLLASYLMKRGIL